MPSLLPPSVYSEGMEDGLFVSERFWLNGETGAMRKGLGVGGAGRGLRGTWGHAETLSGAYLGPHPSSLSPAPGQALPPAGTLGAEHQRTAGIPSLFPKLRTPSEALWLAQLRSGARP